MRIHYQGHVYVLAAAAMETVPVQRLKDEMKQQRPWSGTPAGGARLQNLSGISSAHKTRSEWARKWREQVVALAGDNQTLKLQRLQVRPRGRRVSGFLLEVWYAGTKVIAIVRHLRTQYEVVANTTLKSYLKSRELEEIV